MTTFVKTFSYVDINSLPEGNYEIIDGERIDMGPTGFEHGYLEKIFCKLLDDHFGNAGYIAVGEVGVLIKKEPLRLRAADVIYISKNKLPEKPKGTLEEAPDLIVEIVSESNTLWEINDKIKDYLTAGVERIIIVDPQTETLSVHQKGAGESAHHRFDEVFEVVEGLRVRLKDLLD